MSSADYALYERSTIDLARTVTIGHKMIAESINDQLVKDGYTVSEDLTQWKYYMNLAGEYHQSDRDYIATINSDGNSSIQIQLGGLSGQYYVDLTKELLHDVNSDPTIAVEYRYGSRGFDSLVDRYPRAIDLISGILYPVDKVVAINAEAGSILQIAGYVREEDLNYPDRFHFKKSSLHTASGFNMLDDREISIIYELDIWIKKILSRWLVNDYIFFNEYYLITLLAMIHTLLPAKIMLLRIQKTGTYEACSYHVHERLDSIGYIGKYMDQLPEEVYMYLYRNYDRLDKSRGRADILDELIANVLEPMSIPADQYSTRLENTKFDNLLPYPKFTSSRMTKAGKGNGVKYLGIEATLGLQLSVAEDNPRDILGDVQNSYADLPRQSSPVQLSKMIDSEWKIYGQDAVITVEDFLISNWTYYSSSNRIGGFVFVEDPINGDTIPLNNEAALYLAFYCYCRGLHGVTPATIPSFTSQIVSKSSGYTPPGHRPMPTVLEMYHRHPKNFDYAFIEQFKGQIEPTGYYPSAKSFYEGLYEQYNELSRRYRVWCTQYTAEDRAFLKRLNSELFWGGVRVEPTKFNDSYVDFILGLGINLIDLDQAAYRNMFFDIVRRATGNSDTSDDQYRRIHDSAMSVMRHFMSYPVQFTHRTIVGDVEVRNIPVVRMTADDMYAEYMTYLNLPRLRMDVSVSANRLGEHSATLRVNTNLGSVYHTADFTPTDVNGNPLPETTVPVPARRKPTRVYTSNGSSSISITNRGVGHVTVSED